MKINFFDYQYLSTVIMPNVYGGEGDNVMFLNKRCLKSTVRSNDAFLWKAGKQQRTSYRTNWDGVNRWLMIELAFTL